MPVPLASLLGRRFQLYFPRRLHKIHEQLLCKLVRRHALRVPLNSNHPIVGRLQFDAFDNSVRAAGGDSQVSARPVNRLVMAAVDVNARRPGKLFQVAANGQCCVVL